MQAEIGVAAAQLQALGQDLALLTLSASGEFEDADIVLDLDLPPAPEEAAGIPPPPPPPPEFKRVTKKEGKLENSATRQIMKELQELSSESYSDEQLKIEMVDDNPFKLKVILMPNDGLYKDGYYEMLMTLPPNYPSQKPSFHCPCEIFHPNVDYSGSICFSLLGESSSHLRITDFAHGLLWLLYYPNLYSRMNSDCPREEKEFAQLVRSSIVGGKVCGREYQRSRRLPKKESKGEKEVNLKGEKNGKEWVWKMVGQEWVQVFE